MRLFKKRIDNRPKVMIDPTLALALAPVALLLLLIYWMDAPKKEPVGQLAKAFAFGALSIVPAFVIEYVLQALMPEGLGNLEASCYEAFLVAGLTEEVVKMTFLCLAVWKCRYFDEYFDGIVYSACVALGFACLENISYVFGAGDVVSQMTTGVTRALLAVPAHFLFGVTMGYFFALYKFNRRLKGLNFLLALLLPVMLHGIYDGLLIYSETFGEDTAGTLMKAGLFLVFIGFDVLMWLWGLSRLKRLQRLSKEVENPLDDPFSGQNFPL